MRYEIIDNGAGMRCQKCGNTTYHPEDIKNKYCGYCREFLTDDVVATSAIQPEWDMTLIGFVLDKSGSMSSQREAATTGFNHFVQQIRGYGKPARLTLTLFDTEFKIVHDNADLVSVPDMGYESYTPDGCTALYDAVGHSVASMDKELRRYLKARAIIVILTDGQENSSREFSRDAIKGLIANKEALGNWSFVYLTSALDGWSDGMSVGISAGNMVLYSTATASGTICAAAIGTAQYLSSGQGSTKAFTSANAQDYQDLGNKIKPTDVS